MVLMNSKQAAVEGVCGELIDVCSRTPAISAAFSAEELEAMFEPSNHIGVSGEIVDEAVALARTAIQTTE